MKFLKPFFTFPFHSFPLFKKMVEIENFYNQGFGWICRRCEKEQLAENQNSDQNMPRVWREGEAESKQPKLAAPIAKWFDSARTKLICPRCGTIEAISNA